MLADLLRRWPAAPLYYSKVITFSGYQWEVKTATSPTGPGPNYYSDANAWVDSSGKLHLKITYANGKWYCAEILSKTKFGFGKYEFFVEGPLATLDPRVVVGLFTYPTSDVGPDGTNEIDLKFTRWGDPKIPWGNYTVYPKSLGPGSITHPFNDNLNGTYTTHRFTWKSTQVYFQSLHGHRTDNSFQFESWTTPSSFASYIPQKPVPVHMNLWLFGGKKYYSNTTCVEIIIHSFKFYPQ